MPANLILTLQLICISAFHSSASLSSLDFFSPCLYNKTHSKVLLTMFYCQWYLNNSPFCGSLTAMQVHMLSLQIVPEAADVGCPRQHCKVWKCSVESWSFRSPFLVCDSDEGDLTWKTNENVLFKEKSSDSQVVHFPSTRKSFLTHLCPLKSPVGMSNIYN